MVPYHTTERHARPPGGRVTPRPQVAYTPLHHLLLTHALYGGLVVGDGYIVVAGQRWSHEAYLAVARLVLGDLLGLQAPDFLGGTAAVPTPVGVGVLHRWDAELVGGAK